MYFQRTAELYKRSVNIAQANISFMDGSRAQNSNAPEPSRSSLNAGATSAAPTQQTELDRNAATGGRQTRDSVKSLDAVLDAGWRCDSGTVEQRCQVAVDWRVTVQNPAPATQVRTDVARWLLERGIRCLGALERCRHSGDLKTELTPIASRQIANGTRIN